MTEKIILIGGGGHCKSCIDVIEKEKRFQIGGILDAQLNKDSLICNYPILGDDRLIEEFKQKGANFFITVGFIKSSLIREKIFAYLESLQIDLPVIISPYSIISKFCQIGKGTIVMHQALINADVKLGENCIINNKALVEHDTLIGDNVHISTGAILNGNCIIGNNVFIGSQAVINNGIKLGRNVIIGAGSVVVHTIEEPGIYVGNPAKKIKQ